HTAGIGDADEIEVSLNIPSGQTADSLAAYRNSILQRSIGLIADPPKVAGEGTVHYVLQLDGKFLTLSCALGIGHLQVLGGVGVISRLSGLQESVYGAAGRVTSQGVGCGLSGRPIFGLGRLPGYQLPGGSH